MTPRVRTGILLIATGTFVFVAALGFFCIALGLDLQNEGWSGAVDNPREKASWNSLQMVVSSIGFVISIVLFFAGVQKVSNG